MQNSSHENNMLSNILKDYFNNDIKLWLKSKDKIFIINKSDVFYQIDIYNENISKLIVSNENSIIESTIAKDLCNKNIIDLSYGLCHYIARTINNKIYCWGSNYWAQLGNGRKDENAVQENNPELNELLSDLNITVIKCGAHHSLALTQSGEAYAWGSNYRGQIGCGDNYIKSMPTKLKALNDIKIKMISCGFSHSIALTENGCVYSWGLNEDGQLGIGSTKNSNTPKQIQMKDIIIDKITCGETHSLLLTNNGVIYAFGNNILGQIGNGMKGCIETPIKLNHEKRFIDIASHWRANISIAQSLDNKYYIWGDCNEQNILIPTETKLRSFNEILVHYSGYCLEMSEKFIEFNELIFENGFYEGVFDEIEKIGEGSYGTVFKVKRKGCTDNWAIKKLSLKKEFRSDILREMNRLSVVQRLISQYVVEHRYSWLENTRIDDMITLYISMELCDKTLQQLMNEINNDSNIKDNENLTQIGYYIASQLFIEILECVQYLHKNQIIHRDLNPYNIMIKMNRKNNRFINICDFGLIAIHKFAQQSHTEGRGHIRYAAPEVLNGRKYDAKADIYSLGIILINLFDIDIYWYENNPNYDFY
jgi:alpha-tubulin suppressor-like RCC1 family protein/tRNA A-37 threonylcarbamoyl transferase component Bud32